MRRTTALVAAVLVLSSCGQGDGGTATPATPSPTPSPSPSAADGCPERYPAAEQQPWVPAPPTTETPGRLVPDADPVEVLVCRYGAASTTLDGAVLLEAGLDRIRTDLLVPARVEGAERACTPAAGVVPHLARLRYADGELWLSAAQEPDRCSGSGNGAFVSSAHLGDLLAQAHDTGMWPSPDPDPCGQAALGRAGQERTLVPDGWTSLVVCADGGPREVAPDRASQVVSLLRQLETRPATDACEAAPTSRATLGAAYPAGPPVVVQWTPGCSPSLGNGSLSGVPTPAQEELLGVLLG